ncbi:MAG TPA: YciI family protein [Actinomycetes bacterium]
MPQYLVLIYGDEQTWESWTEEQERANGEGHVRFQALAGDAILGGKELGRTRTARSVRGHRNGRPVVTDGPFVETKEVLGGYYVIEAADLDAAVALAAHLPEADTDYSGVEVRPVA